MTISLLDSDTAMAQILHAAPEDRIGLVRRMWEPMTGMYFFIPDVDMAQTHQQNFGFGLDGPVDRLREGMEALIVANAWERIEVALQDAAATLEAVDGVSVPDLKVLVVLGDPTNEHFVDEIQGLSAFGGISGYITITLWPTDRVLERLEAIAVHELHHNVRYSPGGVRWDPATVTVGEHVIAEGLADLFAVQLHGETGYTHFVAPHTRTDDAVLARMVSGLQVIGMQDLSSWVLGDASARLFGAAPVGVPTGAGYAVGARLVQAYLDIAGGTAAQHVHVDAAEILRVALPQLGFSAFSD